MGSAPRGWRLGPGLEATPVTGGARSARRIASSAAVPTSSCSSVGSRVASRRWISVPGRRTARASAESGLRSHHANSSTASRHRGEPAATPRSARPGALEQALDDELAGDREDEQRGDQMRAAALVLLGTSDRIGLPLLVGADRLVLDAVVGGEVGSAQGHGGRQQAERRGEALARRRRLRAAAQQAAGGGRGDGGEQDARVLERQPRLGQLAGARAGSTAKASASFSGPRSSGSAAGPRREASASAPEATLIAPSARARRRRPRRRAVDEQPVAKRHAAEAQPPRPGAVA